MKRKLLSILLSLVALSCAGQSNTENRHFPIIRYNPTTYLSDIESALANSGSCNCLSADSQLLSGIDKEVMAYLSEQDAFIIILKDDVAKHAPKFIGIRDKESGYLKYLDVKKESFRYSLEHVIEDLYGSLEDYVATWPEDQRHLFYDDPQGLYTFPTKRFVDEKARFIGQDANYFSKWVNERMTYPDEALEDAAIGRVTLQFVIDMFGNLEHVKILRGRHPALDSTAFNVVASSPRWTPAKDFIGNPHSVTYTFPVIFTPEMMFEAFISKMYDERLYEDYDFLKKHCSPELLTKLQDAYPYDSDEPAYATWLFRSGQQDSKPGSDGKSAILKVTSNGNWYTYKALDMGWEFTNRIKMECRDGKIIINDMHITADHAKATVRNSYLYHWHKVQDINLTIAAFCELAKQLMPDIHLDPSQIKAFIMTSEKEDAVIDEDLRNIFTAGTYYTPLCRCNLYPYMKEQLSRETFKEFYKAYNSWKSDLMTALRTIKDKCYREISLELYGNDHDIISKYDIIQYLIKTEK